MKRHPLIAALFALAACSPGASNDEIVSADAEVGDVGVDADEGCIRDCDSDTACEDVPCPADMSDVDAMIADGGADSGVDRSDDAGSPDIGPGPFRALLFHRTEGYRHPSIPDALTALGAMAADNEFEVEVSEDPTIITDDELARFDVVVFVMTTGDILDDEQQAAFERYVGGGGGWVGIHSASDTEYDWPWYGGLVGAYFENHPSVQLAVVNVEERTHPSTVHLGETWERRDEWYNFGTNPRSTVHVLASLDETTYDGGQMDGDHPIAWCHEYEGARAWYTGGGHTIEAYGEAEFLDHLLGGIRWAAGRAEGDCLP